MFVSHIFISPGKLKYQFLFMMSILWYSEKEKKPSYTHKRLSLDD